MIGFYQVTQRIKDQLLTDANVNTVTYGDPSKIDEYKQTMFPVSHFFVSNVTNNDSTLTFSISVLAMDSIISSSDETTDVFIGNNNEQDVLNTQLAVLNKLVQVLRGGQLHTDKFQLIGTPNYEPDLGRFGNQISGWAASFDVIVPNDIEIC
jgi:hypothetical protein